MQKDKASSASETKNLPFKAIIYHIHVHVLIQNYSISSVSAMEIPQSCTKLLIYIMTDEVFQLVYVACLQMS